MTRVLAVAGSAGLMMVLSGCASAPLTRAEVDGRIVCDSDRMDRAEREARKNGAGIVWVNCPTATLRVASYRGLQQ